jgi:hypothetical protein
MAFHEFAPQAAFGFAAHLNQLQRPTLIQRAFHWRGLETGGGYIDPARTPSSQTPKFR